LLFVNTKSSIAKEPFLYKEEKALLLFFLAVATLKPFKIKGLQRCRGYLSLEMRGIEPLSENLSIRTSPITAFLFTFPQNIAEKQAISLSSFINLFYWQSLQ